MHKTIVRCLVCLLVPFLLVPFIVLTGCGGGGNPPSTPPSQEPPAPYSNATLNGTYVMTATGGNMLGKMSMAALFTANGQGQLTDGALLVNSFGSVAQVIDSAFTGTYSVGADGRGTATFTPTGSAAMTFRFVITATGINVIRFNTDAVATGVILKQNMGTVAGVNGRFVFNFDGLRYVNGQTFEQHSAGLLTINGGEVSTSREVVYSGVGISEGTVEEIGPFTLAANGIGTATLNANGSALRVRFFVVSADRVVLITDEETKLLSGVAERQTTAGNTGVNTVLNGDYVFLTQGTDVGMGMITPWVGLGRFTADGTGVINGVRDTSGLAGNEVNAPFSATYNMIADGHGTMIIPGGPQITIYTISADRGLMVGSGVNTYTWGVFQKQSGGPFSAATITGKFGTVMGAGPTYVSGVWNVTSSGTVNGTVDLYDNGTLITGQAITGTYQVDATGRGNTTVVATGISMGMDVAFYAVSPTEVWMMATVPAMVVGQANKQ